MIWRKRSLTTVAPPPLPAAVDARRGSGQAQNTSRLAGFGEFIVTGLMAAGSGAGTALTLITGKFVLAGVLALVTVGIVLRFANRRRLRAAPPLPTPAWAHASAALVSLLLCAVLVEAVKLPVRYDQPGFERTNWLIVLLALLVAYRLQLGAIKAILLARSNSASQTAQ